MATLKRYYGRPDSVEDATEDFGSSVNLGVPDDIDIQNDDESIQAMEYLRRVKKEANSLPFAVEAVYPTNKLSSPQVLKFEASDSLSDSEVNSVMVEYFCSLREFVNKQRVIRETKHIEFVEGISDTILHSADYVSITNAIDELADCVPDLSPVVAVEYIWALLIHLEDPLLEDTAASLQILRRYCDSITEDKKISYQAKACSIIISSFFHQPAA